MTPLDQMGDLAEQWDAWAVKAQQHHAAGQHAAEVACLDQAEACCAEARMVAVTSGDPALERFWDED